MGMLFDPFDPGFRADPYPALARLRAEDPVHWLEMPGMWIVSRYADVTAVLRDDARFSSHRPLFDRIAAIAPAGRPQAFLQRARGTMLATDPPDHTRLRGLVTKAFGPRVVESMRPRAERLARDLLDAARGRPLELIADLAVPLPLYVIMELLGLPASDRPLMKRWSDDLSILVDGTIALDRLGPAEQSADEFERYIRDVFAARRRAPRDDLVSGLLAAREHGDVLSDEELVSTCAILLVAGHETTTGLIGNGVLALLRHPDVLARLRNEPALVRGAVEELARYDAPVQLVTRTARTDVALGERTIRAGQEVVLLLGAANRDPARFPDPDRLDVERPDNRHLAFGAGIHFCVGAPLARLEAQVALETLLARHPTPALASDAIEWRPGFVLRSPAELRLAG